MSLGAPGELSERPYFVGYEELRRIDYRRLARVAIYHQLGAMCSIVDQFYRPEKRAFMESLGAVYAELVEAVARMPDAA